MLKRKVNLGNIFLAGIFFVVSFTVLNWNNPSEAAALNFFGVFNKFTVWSKKPKKGFDVAGTKLSVDLTLETQTLPVPIGAGTILYAIDPPAAKMFDGRITITYDSTLLNLDKYGWFGDWGIDPNLPPPPIDSNLNGSPWYLQIQANPLLTESVIISGDAIKTIEVNYDWGATGYTPPTTEHFNLFGLEFSAAQENITYEQAAAAIALPQNEFENSGIGYSTASANYNHCIPVESQDGKIVLCGDGERVPEPLTILGSATALGFIPLFKKAYLRRQKKSKKID